MQELSLSLSRSELCHDMTLVGFAPDVILVATVGRVMSRGPCEDGRPAGHPHAESVQTDGTSSVRLACGDADLGAETIPKAVRKPRARVDKHAGRVDAPGEGADGFAVFGHDDVRVMGRVGVDVFDGGREGGHSEDGESRGEVFQEVGLRRGALEEVCVLLLGLRGDGREGLSIADERD